MSEASVDLGDGAYLFSQHLDRAAQAALVDELRAVLKSTPFYVPVMPRTGQPMRVRMTNMGPLGWVTDKDRGYRYQDVHPVTGDAWPDIPDMLLGLWYDVSSAAYPPEACLVNLYDADSRMGLHRDQDEQAKDAPVVSISLGSDAVFRLGGPERRSPTRSFPLKSGDVLVLSGPARHFYHGVDRIRAGSSSLLDGAERMNLTLRRVMPPD